MPYIPTCNFGMFCLNKLFYVWASLVPVQAHARAGKEGLGKWMAQKLEKTVLECN